MTSTQEQPVQQQQQKIGRDRGADTQKIVRNDFAGSAFGPRWVPGLTAPMPSPQYYIDQARTLLSWAQATTDKAYAAALRRQAAKQLERTNDARAAIPDLNPILTDFNDRQMIGSDK